MIKTATILIAAMLPEEHGIDPGGIGNALSPTTVSFFSGDAGSRAMPGPEVAPT